MAKVTFKITSVGDGGFTTKEPYVPEYVPGQLIFVEDTRKIYLDFHGERVCYTPSSMNYIGISTTDPKSGTVTVDGVVIQARERDLVVYKTKEYMYRKGTDGHLAWYEVGDEDSPEWEE